jgi:hypothetical protein
LRRELSCEVTGNAGLCPAPRFQLAPEFKLPTPGWHWHHTPPNMLFNHIRQEVRDTTHDSPAYWRGRSPEL